MRTAFLTLLVFVFPGIAFAQPVSSIHRGEVVEVHSSGIESIEGTALSEEYQNLSIRIIEGDRTGEVVPAYNDSSAIFKPGEILYVRSTVLSEGEEEQWVVVEPDRRTVLISLAILFALVTALAGGMAGVRSLVALVASFLIIIFGLLPALMAGAPPALTSTLFAGVMLAVSMVITHGTKRETFIALAGSAAALLVAVVVAEAAVRLARLSGFVSDEAVYLNFQTDGTLDLAGLLLGGILIGIVGVLNDISVSQVHTVSELRAANPALTRQELLRKAMRVGQEHLGAVVNTLPLAYAGAALPLLLLFSTTDAPLLLVINREVFASEVIRVLAGGIALSLSGVVATILAVYAFTRRKG